MSDNVIAGTTPTFRALSDGSVEWPAQVLAYPTTIAAGANVIQLVDGTHGLPVAVIGSVAVTGTFWQATQPVSGPLTDAQLRASTVPVSGTFFQATQPVSLAAIPALAAGSNVIGHVILDSGAVTATLSAETTKVIGTINISASQTIGLAAGSAVIGHVIVDSGTVTTVSTVTNVSQFGGQAIAMGTGARSAGTQRVTIATDDSVPVTNTGTFAVQAAQSGTFTVGLSAAQTLATVTTVGTLSTITNVVHVDDNAGSITVDAPVGTPAFVRLSDGSAAITTLPVSLASVPSHAVTNAGTFGIQNTATATSSGLSTYQAISAGSNNAANVKSSAGQLYGLQCFNLNASPRYVKFYNVSGTPTPGSDTVVKSILIPGNTSGGGVVIKFDPPIPFPTGIGIACVTGISNTDNTSTSASECILNVDFK